MYNHKRSIKKTSRFMPCSTHLRTWKAPYGDALGEIMLASSREKKV